jgi:dGTPase
MAVSRFDRLHPGDRADDQRSASQRDRDRVLYSSAFRRLAGVTQVVSAGEGHIFHNRLTHTLKVAQIGRRLAENLATRQTEVAAALGVDPDVTEAAALAHDLGHPPFGHIAEKELDRLATQHGATDGFEGNAQSFRIVTKLAVRHPDLPGLNLTRASLNAVLKYPWLREQSGKRNKKFGAYRSEQRELAWARELCPNDDLGQGAEAAMMDWADDIAYSVHDVEDFYRAGLIPLDRLIADDTESRRFLDRALARWGEHGGSDPLAVSDYERRFDGLRQFASIFQIDAPFRGTRQQRAGLRSLTSTLVARYVDGISLQLPATLDAARVRIQPEYLQEIRLLKELVWQYVILNPSLATQQHGQTAVIEKLFETYIRAARASNYAIFPPRAQEELRQSADELTNHDDLDIARIRTVVDLVASMTEEQAVRLFRRMIGTSLGSITDVIH